jgi:hypothetical protein
VRLVSAPTGRCGVATITVTVADARNTLWIETGEVLETATRLASSFSWLTTALLPLAGEGGPKGRMRARLLRENPHLTPLLRAPARASGAGVRRHDAPVARRLCRLNPYAGEGLNPGQLKLDASQELL